MRLTLLFALVACFAVCNAQVGWEVETVVDIYRVNPQTNTIRNFNVREVIPINSPIKKINPADDSTAPVTNPLLGIFQAQRVWKWTLDGVSICVSAGSAAQRTSFEKILDLKAYKDYETSASRVPIAKKGPTVAYTQDEVDNVKRFAVQYNQALSDTYQDEMTQYEALMEEYKKKKSASSSSSSSSSDEEHVDVPEPDSSSEAPPEAPEAPIKLPSMFITEKVNGQTTVDIPKKYKAYAPPPSSEDHYIFMGRDIGKRTHTKHDFGCKAILELKTEAAGGGPLPFAQASIQSAKADLATLLADGAPLHDNFEGTYVVEASASDHWILQFRTGPKFFRNKDMQFTYNELITNLGSVADLSITGWPAAPVTTVNAAQQAAQRLALKLKSQACSYDKNNQHPYVKRSTPKIIFRQLEKASPFKATRKVLQRNKAKTAAAYLVNAGTSAGELDDFAKQCVTDNAFCTTPKQQEYAKTQCLAAYFPFYRRSTGVEKFMVTLEQRMDCASQICQCVADSACDVAATYTKYKDALK